MKTLRLALIAAAASITVTAAIAQTSQQTTSQPEQSGYAGCGSKARPAATS